MRRINETQRVMGLVAVAVTAGLGVAAFANGPSSSRAEATPIQLARPVAQAAGVPAPATKTGPARKVRVVYAGPIVASAEPGEPDSARMAVPATSSAVAGDVPSQGEPGGDRRRFVDTTGSVNPEPPAQTAALSTEPTAERAESPGIDLNTASIDELNALGAGRIGRAIARGRPYAAPEDLLRKRIVTRATFARIRDQIAVE